MLDIPGIETLQARPRVRKVHSRVEYAPYWWVSVDDLMWCINLNLAAVTCKDICLKKPSELFERYSLLSGYHEDGTPAITWIKPGPGMTGGTNDPRSPFDGEMGNTLDPAQVLVPKGFSDAVLDCTSQHFERVVARKLLKGRPLLLVAISFNDTERIITREAHGAFQVL